MKNVFMYIILALLFTTPSYAQRSIKVPSRFVETRPPATPSKAWHRLNASNKEFRVRNLEGALEIKHARPMNWTHLSISGGILKGVNYGEFGGSLTFTPDDNSQQPVEIKTGNVLFIFTLHNKIYFIEGLTHMSINRGALYELSRDGAHFTYKQLLDFDDAPEALAIYKDQLLIAGYSSFYIVNNFKNETIFKQTFWAGLYPNSIAAFDDENVFIGMRGGIVKLDLIKRAMVFYKND